MSPLATLPDRSPWVNSGGVAIACSDDTTSGSARDRSDCKWCHQPFPFYRRRDAIYCSKKCRQASWRFGVAPTRVKTLPTDRPMKFAYADPPYPGKAHYYPEQREVDHRSLLDRLTTDYPDGWALSTSSRALRDVLSLCPPGVRVCAWFKGPRPARSRLALASWEPLIVVGGRPHATDDICRVADGLIACGRFRAFPGAMIGMKPPTFAEWMFGQLDASRVDILDDLFPGSGAIGEAWARYTGGLRGDTNSISSFRKIESSTHPDLEVRR